MTCPSRFEIARVFSTAAAGPPSLSAHGVHLRACPRCREVVAELDDARRELFGDDPRGAPAGAAPAAVTTAARRLQAAAIARRGAMRRRWLWGGLPVALAAAVFLLVVGPRAGVVRAKGELGIELYCKRGQAVFPVQDGGDFLSGDRLRFAYTTPQAGYLVVFGVDDRGAIFSYYPQDDLRGVKVTAGERVLLPGSIELDAHHGWERTFALWSRAPFDERALRREVNDSLRAVGGDVRRLTRIGRDGPQVSHLLRRP